MAKILQSSVMALGMIFCSDAQGMETLRRCFGRWMGHQPVAAAPQHVAGADILTDPAEMFPNCFMNVAVGEELLRNRMYFRTELLVFRFSRIALLEGDVMDTINNHFRTMVRFATPLGAIVWMDVSCKIHVFFPSDGRGSGLVPLKAFLREYLDARIPMPGLCGHAVVCIDEVLFSEIVENFSRVAGVELAKAHKFLLTRGLASSGEGIQQIYRCIAGDVFAGISLEEFIGDAK